MRDAPAVDDGGLTVVAHAGGAEQMAVVPHRHAVDGASAGFGEGLGGTVDAPGGRPARVLAESVGHLRGGDPGPVDQRRRELDPVVEIGQVLAEHDPSRATTEAFADVLVVRGTEGRSAAQPERDRERSAGGSEAPLRAAEEPAIGVACRRTASDWIWPPKWPR